MAEGLSDGLDDDAADLPLQTLFGGGDAGRPGDRAFEDVDSKSPSGREGGTRDSEYFHGVIVLLQDKGMPFRRTLFSRRR